MKLSEKIFKLRKEHSMTQEDLAEKLNVSRQAVSRWEMGSAQPDASNVLQLSKLFGVSADYLLNDDWTLEQPPTPEKEDSGNKNARTKRITGLIISGLGLMCNFVIYVISRFIKVMVPRVVHEDGKTWYTWSSEFTAYSYKYFIKEHNLEFLTALFWGMFAAGLCIAFIRRSDLKRLCAFCKTKFSVAHGNGEKES